MEQANSISDYLKILERYKAYTEQYYRGQLEKYATISPSIARNPGYSSNESAIYHESIEMKNDEFSGLLTPLDDYPAGRVYWKKPHLEIYNDESFANDISI